MIIDKLLGIGMTARGALSRRFVTLGESGHVTIMNRRGGNKRNTEGDTRLSEGVWIMKSISQIEAGGRGRRFR